MDSHPTMKQVLKILFPVLLLVSSQSDAVESTAPFAPKATVDKAVLGTVIRLPWFDGRTLEKGKHEVVLSSHPLKPDLAKLTFMGDTRKLDPHAMAELIRRSGESTALPSGISYQRVHLVDGQRIDEAFARKAKHPMEFPVPAGAGIPIGANTGFEDTFPHAASLLRMSMPGYSVSGDLAIVYVVESCGGLCSRGEYIILHQVNDTWKVTERLTAWSS